MIQCVFGLPGSGKSTHMAMSARKAMKKGKKVYCNFWLLGAYKIDFADLGKYDFTDCLILIDEAMNEADSRNFKTFSKEHKYFFSNHRHYGCDVIYYTQCWSDVDLRIRNNTETLLYVRKLFFWSFTIPIKRKIIINDMTQEIQNGYKMSSLFSARFYFRPRYYKYFDSYERKELLPLLPRHYTQYTKENVPTKLTRFQKILAYILLKLTTFRVKRAFKGKQHLFP